MNFVDNKSIKGREDHYAHITVDVPRVVESWRTSLYSFEWLLPDGRVKDLKELSETDQPRRQAIEDAIKSGDPLEKPVLGIGLLENVEIGVGKAVLLTLAAHDVKSVPVHVPKNNESDFKDFIADV